MKKGNINYIYNYWKNSRVFIITAILGALIFMMIYGVHILNPTYTAWLLEGGDTSAHFLGWRFFRNTQWQFPFGIMNNSAYPFHISVIFTDSIPILAVLFKILSPILPENFQYFGIWGIFCFVMQGIMASIILKKYLKSDFEIVIGTLFFILSPVVIQRMYEHTSLAANWLILLALIFLIYQDEKLNNIVKASCAWGTLGIICAGVHIYYVGMCGIILAGFAIKGYLKDKKIKYAIIVLASYCLGVALQIFSLGGFSSELSQASHGGLGGYGVNLNALFNPQGWSSLLQDLPIKADAFEGFAYLGAGIILLLTSTSITMLIRFRKGILEKKNLKKFIYKKLPWIFIVVTSLFIALSPTAALGSTVVYDFPAFGIIGKAWGVFRASGRFVWPIFYLVMIWAICADHRFIRKEAKVVILVLCLILQVYDIHVVLINKNVKYNQEKQYNSLLQDDIWDELSKIKQLEHVVLVSNVFKEEQLVNSILYYASINNMTSNYFPVSHPNLDGLQEELDKLMEELPEDTIYLFSQADREKCLNYDLNYDEADGLIIGTKYD